MIELDWNTIADEISDWIKDYAQNAGIDSLVVGVSGGIDSAVTSTLCAKTGMRTIVFNLPIHQANSQYDLSNKHIEFLQQNWNNVDSHDIDLYRSSHRL